jgi:hypothetical protein
MKPVSCEHQGTANAQHFQFAVARIAPINARPAARCKRRPLPRSARASDELVSIAGVTAVRFRKGVYHG